MAKQSSESFRLHGPHAVRPPGWTPRLIPPSDELFDIEPPPSSNGPPALRGRALADALNAIRLAEPKSS